MVAGLASQSSGLKKCWLVCSEADSSEGRILIALGRQCVYVFGGEGVFLSLGGWLALWGKQAFRSYLGGFEATGSHFGALGPSAYL